MSTVSASEHIVRDVDALLGLLATHAAANAGTPPLTVLMLPAVYSLPAPLPLVDGVELIGAGVRDDVVLTTAPGAATPGGASVVRYDRTRKSLATIADDIARRVAESPSPRAARESPPSPSPPPAAALQTRRQWQCRRSTQRWRLRWPRRRRSAAESRCSVHRWKAGRRQQQRWPHLQRLQGRTQHRFHRRIRRRWRGVGACGSAI